MIVELRSLCGTTPWWYFLYLYAARAHCRFLFVCCCLFFLCVFFVVFCVFYFFYFFIIFFFLYNVFIEIVNSLRFILKAAEQVRANYIDTIRGSGHL